MGNKKFNLAKMNLPDDLRKLSLSDCNLLAEQIRRRLIKTVSKNGGHLASNLGTVELTIAIHRVFKSPEDKIVWDVGHQAYTHKLLTDRAERFSTIRTDGGISGFLRPDESEHDAFISGHSSTSVSAALGIATAMRLKNDPHHAVAVLGDGAFTGGEIYEGLNNAGKSNVRLVIIINYNEMSISENVGAVAKYLSTMRTKESYMKTKTAVEKVLDKTPVVGKPIKNVVRSSKNAFKEMLLHSTMFEDLGFEFVGPLDGHNIAELEAGLKAAKSMDAPTIVVVNTIKGHGYPPAEANPNKYHGVGSFEISTGNPDVVAADSFSSVFGKKLLDMSYDNEKICAVTAAMEFGTGLQHFHAALPERFFDVGIAEEHAVTFCAGLSSMGMIPVFAVYSTFLQRGYDQLLHDLAIMNTHAVIGVDRAGIVGEDGETHQGIFDIPFLTTIPNVNIYSPSSYSELEECLERAINGEGICAVRYPRGSDKIRDDEKYVDFKYQKNGSRVLAVTYGRLYGNLLEAEKSVEEHGEDFDILSPVKIFPIDEKIIEVMKSYDRVFVFEECYKYGSMGEKYSSLTQNCECVSIDGFVRHGRMDNLLDEYGLSSQKMAERILNYFENDKT
ncbi:MAG: 1-deoxy-D-xylulose-5-phosphate synthase [Ruminococcus sp.]|nr:1-deoxy-D-xylulose-5-phosphate synthase [Ruminococcus sp.]